jgi:hypothetical protein
VALRFALLIALDVVLAPPDDFNEFVQARHGGVLQDDGAHGNLEGGKERG